MSPTSTATAPSTSALVAVTAPAFCRSTPVHGRTRHQMSWVVLPLIAALVVLVLAGLTTFAVFGFASHVGFGTTQSAAPPTHAPTRPSIPILRGLVNAPIQLVTVDTSAASPQKPVCVCSSPYVGAIAGPPIVENKALDNLVEGLWRPRASVGDGSTFDAVEYEATTGQLVGGTTHFQKLAESWQKLTNIIKTGDLNESDRTVADELDERFLQATVDIEENPVRAMEANLLAGKSPIAGFSTAAMDAADPELATEVESIEPLLEVVAQAAEDAAEDG